MRTCSFASVLNWVGRRMQGSEEHMTDADAASFTDHINTWVRQCWERFFWPEWTVTEERYFRPTWAMGETYFTGEEVWHPGSAAYWRSLTNENTAEPGSDAEAWERCGVEGARALSRFIALDQSGETPIGSLQGMFTGDPAMHQGSRRIALTLTSDGYRVPASALNSAWLTFRLRAPRFTSKVWDPAKAYAAGARVYHPATEECWIAPAGAAIGQEPGVYTGGAGILSVTTAATGAQWTQLANQQCQQIVIFNDSGTALEVRYCLPDGSDIAGQSSVIVPIGMGQPLRGLSNANGVKIRRADMISNVAVTLSFTYEGEGWIQVEFPEVLADPVKRFAYMEALKDDGQNDKSGIEEARAEEMLADEWSKIEGQQGMTRHYGVLTR